jgi:hypothetical protein
MIHRLAFIRLQPDAASKEGPGSIRFLSMNAQIRLA